MKLHYYPETDSLYIALRNLPAAETRELADGLNADFDTDGNIIGFDIDHASGRLDLDSVEAVSLPLIGNKAA
ncbi:DUF2283 domain-containing protein [Sandarakinorhabdus sp.]|uniref:DUF2283 domain-containing protein n=1 Tax=Sandarakinorhabdus sp. TaxID=1916663 RepID=UPI003F70ADD7